MTGPKNNLEDVLRRKPPTPCLLPSIVTSNTSQPKFKPALALRKNLSGHLPSFSTPGFHNKPPRPKIDIIDLSSTETTPINTVPAVRNLSIKRSSSDSTVSSEHEQSPKRVKKDVTSNKENLSLFGTRDKGKAKETRPSSSVDDEPWTKMEVDQESNPFTRLDRDYPQHAAASATSEPPTNPAPANPNHSDLNSKSLDMLKTLQCADSDFKFKVMDSIVEYVSMQNKNHDITLLNAVNAVIEDRLSALRTAIAARERGEQPSFPAEAQGRTHARSPSVPAPPLSRERMPPPAASITFVSTTREVVQSTRTIREVERDDDDDDGVIIPGSDDYLWETVDDIPMDDLQDDFSSASPSSLATRHDPEPIASISTCTSAIQPTPDQISTPYYKEITRVLKSTFKLESFRANQLEAISATMSGRDVFVLMPTGGGKSLCYQLPAVCKSGSTSGLTVVVSPLIALMNDQVTSLRNIGVDVELWNSENSSDDAYAISRRLNGKQDLPCMLYLTPEKLSESAALKSMLGRLYDAGSLARFVIDEAHCISTWGRDFRDAYAKLDCLRTWFPNVPIMALTATANESVIKNIIDRLSIPNCVFLKQSFNRPNLHYDVREKKKNTVLKEIAAFIKARHANETGIIYCFARAHCEQVAQSLRDDFGLRAEHYHAGMPQAEKKKTQDQWQSGEAQVIVSTIAFGMGIDKKDVRFVIHHTMPKNMDGYYQETGRAGRDGRPADCVLFYQYGDAKALMEQIAKDKDDGTTPLTEEDKTRLTEEVKKVMEYCTNISRCRRVQVLRYFNEVFYERDCHRGCDVCMDDAEVTTRDVTTEAIDAIKLVKSMSGNNSMAHCKAVFVGSKKKEVLQRGHDGLPGHGKGNSLGQKAVDQLFEELIVMDMFREQAIANSAGWSNNYLQPGHRANEVLSGEKRVTIYVKSGGPGSAGPSKKTTKKVASKPVARTASAKSKKTVVQEKKVSLYQTDDYVGSFSDDDEYEPYVPLVDEEDDIVEASSPKLKAWPPVRSTQDRAALLRPSPSIEVIDDGRDVSMSTTDRLQLDLKSLRREIIARDGLTRDDDVFDDMFLLRLSLTPPSDVHNFKELLKDHCDTDMEFVNDKWAKYGKSFLQVCISSKLAPPRSSAANKKASSTSFDSAGMHQRFDYQETSASASKPRSFKFY